MLLNNTEIESTMIMAWCARFKVQWTASELYSECIDWRCAPSLSAPGSVRSDEHFPAAVALCVIHQQLQRFALRRLDQREEVLPLWESTESVISYQSEHLHERLMNRSHLLQHLVCTNNVVRVRLQSSQFSRRLHFHVLTQKRHVFTLI